MPYVDIQIPPQKILGPTIIPENTKPQEVFGYLQGAEMCNPSWDLFKVMFTLYHDKSPSFTRIWENSFCTFSKPLQQVQVNEEDLLTSSYTRKSTKSHPILPWNQNMCPKNQWLEDIHPPKTNIEPKIWWCVDVSPFPMVYFQVPAVSFPGWIYIRKPPPHSEGARPCRKASSAPWVLKEKTNLRNLGFHGY